MATTAVRRPWRFAIKFTLALFLVASFLPIWISWWFNSWEGLGTATDFWSMLASLPSGYGQNSAARFIFHYHGSNLGIFAGILAIGLGVGRWLGGRG